MFDSKRRAIEISGDEKGGEVEGHKHLGSFVQSKGSIVVDVKHRISNFVWIK